MNPRLTFTGLVGEEHVGKRIISQLKTNFKGDAILITVSYALKERPHFAAEKFDPDIEHSIAGMLGGTTLKDMIYSHGERMAGRVPDFAIPTYCLPHKDDPTQNAEGNSVMNLYLEVPYTIYKSGGPKMWDDKEFKRDVAERITDVFEANSPGFRENVLDYWITTPLDHCRSNPNYLRGCWAGGSWSAPQTWFANRPGAEGFDKGGIVTPIKNLYGSGSVGPSFSGGGNGYRAACHITEELGMRNQPWWNHRPMEYYLKKYVEKTYVPLKLGSVLDK